MSKGVESKMGKTVLFPFLPIGNYVLKMKNIAKINWTSIYSKIAVHM